MSLYRPLRAILDAFAEELNDFGGLTLTRLTAALPPATLGLAVPAEALTASVETTYGFPATGRVVVRGEVMAYTGKTDTTLTGLTRDDSVRETYPRGETVVLWTRDVSALDKARLSLFVDTAEAEFLDVVGQNYGVPRYLDASDALYRRFVRAMAYQAAKGSRTALDEFLRLILDGRGLAGTDGVCAYVGAEARLTSAAGLFTSRMRDMRVEIKGANEKNQRILKILSVPDANTLVLDKRGSPWWEPAQITAEAGVPWEILPWDVFESPWRRCTVLVRLNLAPATTAAGFAYLQGGEAALPINVTTVPVTLPIRQVLGVWLAEDTFRRGTNYATDNNFAGLNITLNTPLDKVRPVVVDYGSVNVPGMAPTTGVPGAARAPATGQLLADVNTRNTSTPLRYPLYLGDRVGTIRALLNVLTVAGVVPELDVQTW